MIPRGSAALRALAMKLATAIAPETTSNYAAANTGLITMLLQCLAEDYERAAHTRLTDIKEMQELFGNLPAGLPSAQKAKLAAYGSESPTSFLISDLDALHARGLEALIVLHAFVETAGDTERDRRIWAFLERHAERHSFQLTGM